MKRSVSSDFLIFAGHKDSSAQIADTPMLANSNRDPSTNVINATNKPR